MEEKFINVEDYEGDWRGLREEERKYVKGWLTASDLYMRRTGNCLTPVIVTIMSILCIAVFSIFDKDLAMCAAVGSPFLIIFSLLGSLSLVASGDEAYTYSVNNEVLCVLDVSMELKSSRGTNRVTTFARITTLDGIKILDSDKRYDQTLFAYEGEDTVNDKALLVRVTFSDKERYVVIPAIGNGYKTVQKGEKLWEAHYTDVG